MKEIENFYYNKRIVSNSLIKAKNSVDSLSESSSVSCKLKKKSPLHKWNEGPGGGLLSVLKGK